MAQTPFVDGDILTAAQLNSRCLGEDGAWTSWTPTVTQSGSVTVTNTRSVYARWGRLIHFSFFLSVTGSGTGSNAIVISLPVTAAASDILGVTGVLIDSSTSDVYAFSHYPSSTTAFRLKATSVASGTGLLGAGGFTAGLASGDTIRGFGSYEAAS